MNPLFWAAIVFAVWEAWSFLDGDMRQNDDNQQAELRARGARASARIVSVHEVRTGRHRNSRYSWANITCEFTDSSGRTRRAASIEGYNWLYQKKPSWAPGGIWAPGARVEVIYMPDEPDNFRIASVVRAYQVEPASTWDFFLALFFIWYFTAAWLSLLIFFIFIRPHIRKPSTVTP